MSKVSLKVTKDSTMYDLAKVFGTTVKELREANKLKDDYLKVGQIIQFDTDDVEGVKKRLSDLQKYREYKYNKAKAAYDADQAKRKKASIVTSKSDDTEGLSELQRKDYLLNKEEKGWNSAEDYKSYLNNEHKSAQSTRDLAFKGGAGALGLAGGTYLAANSELLTPIAKAFIPTTAQDATALVTSEAADKLAEKAGITNPWVRAGIGLIGGVGGWSAMNNLARGTAKAVTNYGKNQVNKAVALRQQITGAPKQAKEAIPEYYAGVQKQIDKALNKADAASKILDSNVGKVMLNPTTTGSAASDAAIYGIQTAVPTVAVTGVDSVMPEEVRNNSLYQVGKTMLPFIPGVGKTYSKISGKLIDASGGGRGLTDIAKNMLIGKHFSGTYRHGVNQLNHQLDPSRVAKGMVGYKDLQTNFNSVNGFNSPFINTGSVRQNQAIVLPKNASSDEFKRAYMGSVGGNRYGTGVTYQTTGHKIDDDLDWKNLHFSNGGQREPIALDMGNGRYVINPKAKSRQQGVRDDDPTIGYQVLDRKNNVICQGFSDPKNVPLKDSEHITSVRTNWSGHNALPTNRNLGDDAIMLKIDTNGYMDTGNAYNDGSSKSLTRRFSTFAGRMLDFNNNHLYDMGTPSLSQVTSRGTKTILAHPTIKNTSVSHLGDKTANDLIKKADTGLLSNIKKRFMEKIIKKQNNLADSWKGSDDFNRIQTQRKEQMRTNKNYTEEVNKGLGTTYR